MADAARRGADYLERLHRQAVYPRDADVERLRTALGGDLPADPAPDAEVLHFLDEYGSPATVASAGGRYFGFVTGGALPVSVAAHVLATAWDQNAFSFTSSPAAALFDEAAIRWLRDLFGLPAESAGSFVAGASAANFAGLAAARHAVLARAGWNVEADGLVGAPPVTVIVGAEAHPTLFKSLGLLGLGRNRAIRVPVDAQGRLLAAQLPRIAGPTIVCTQAGNVNSGAFDPIGEVCARTAGSGAWVHVDGAVGLWAAAVPELRHLVAGMAEADSWSTDPHKGLNVPYDSGLAFVRDGAALQAAMAITAEYLPSASTVRNPSDFTPELSRRARGVDVWAALRSLGRNGVAAMFGGCVRHAQRFAEGLRAAGHEVLNEVVLNQVVVSFGDEATTSRVIAALQADGTCWCGGTVWQGRPAMRISVSSWATTAADVEKSLAAILRVARATATPQGLRRT